MLMLEGDKNLLAEALSKRATITSECSEMYFPAEKIRH